MITRIRHSVGPALLLVLGLGLLGPTAARADVLDLLMVVATPSSLSTSESNAKTQFETWGYTVTLIDDDATQTTYNNMISGKNVAYVSVAVNATSLGTKLASTTIGVLISQPSLCDEFGVADSSNSSVNQKPISIKNTTHYITYGQSLNDNLFILSSGQTLYRRTGTIAPGAVNLADVERTPGQTDPGFLILEVGGSKYGGGTSPGRRVLLPWGDNTFSFSALNAAGLNILKRTLEWAARPNPSLGYLLFVVTNISTPDTQETLRKMQMEVFGYNVTFIAATDSQANYNAAMAGKNLVYVSEKISSSDVSTKLTSATIGVVNEEAELNDELKISSSRTFLSASSITITNNSHYITSKFSTGSVALFTSSQSATAVAGTLAPGLQTLGKWSSDRGLAVLEKGAALDGGEYAAGRRVQMPWGGGTFDLNTLTQHGRTLMRRAIGWAAATPGTSILFVVADADAPSTEEAARIALLEGWTYSVIVIDDDASQANFNAAVGGVGTTYIPSTVSAGSLGTKLTNAGIGIVNENADLADELKISTSQTFSSGSSVNIVDDTHYITSQFVNGSLAIFSSSQPNASLAGTMSKDVVVLGKWGSNISLAALEAGGKLTDNTSAPGRRVTLPWGGSSFVTSSLTTDGRTLMKRSIEWARGLAGHWRLDETSGTTAIDSSANKNHGSLYGLSLPANSVTPAKLASAFSFNGTTSYISIPNAASLQPTNKLSISAWIKGNSWGSADSVDAILRKGEANPNNWQLAIADGRVALYLDDNDSFGYRGDTVLQTGKWYHVAATWDGSNVQIYLDGVPDRASPANKSLPIGVDSRPAYIGGRSGADQFNGVIDDVRLYDYALSSSEIMNLKRTFQPRGVRIIKWVEIQ